MIYAQINNGIIQNTIITDINTNLAEFSQNFDSFIRIDTLPIVPGIGWTYDGVKFLAPPKVQPVVTGNQQISELIDALVQKNIIIKGPDGTITPSAVAIPVADPVS